MKRAFLLVAAVVVAMNLYAVVVTNSQTTGKQTTNDVKIRQRMSMGNGAGAESLLYIKGARMRTEMQGNVGYTTILQCDLKRTLTINDNTKTYLVSSTDGPGAASMGEGDGGGAAGMPNPQPQQTRGGIVNVTNTITDTGERKQMFGFTARHIKTSMVKTSSPEACDKDAKIETDGWYIDFSYGMDCPSQMEKHQPYVRPQQPGCKDEVRMKTIGTAKLGFPLLVTTTIYQPDGRTSTMTQEVLELSKEPLSASLFDVPEGYTLAKSMSELYGINAAAGGAAAYNPQSINNAAANTSVTAASTAKKPGVIRIGLLRPKVELSSGDAAGTTETLRSSFVSNLNGANVEVVALSSQQLSQALDEARKSQCDYLLTVSLNIKKGGGSMFGRAIGNIAASAAGVPSGGASNGIKAKDELTLQFMLDNLQTSSTVLSNTSKAKAKSDGEDIITPEVQKASQAILAAVKK